MLDGQQNAPRHPGVIAGLGAQRPKAIAADLLRQLRVILRAAEIPGQVLPFLRQNSFVDKPDQAVQVKDVFLNRRSRNQDFESVPRDTPQCSGLPVFLPVHAGQGGGFLEYRDVPGYGRGFRLMGGGKVIGGNHKAALVKSGFPSGGGDRVGERVVTVQQIGPLAEQVRVGDAEQDALIPFQIPLGHNEHRFMAFPHTGLVTENHAFLPGRPQGKARRRDLVGVDLNIRGSVDRQQLFLVRQALQHPRLIVGVEWCEVHFTHLPPVQYNMTLLPCQTALPLQMPITVVSRDSCP